MEGVLFFWDVLLFFYMFGNLDSACMGWALCFCAWYCIVSQILGLIKHVPVLY